MNKSLLLLMSGLALAASNTVAAEVASCFPEPALKAGTCRDIVPSGQARTLRMTLPLLAPKSGKWLWSVGRTFDLYIPAKYNPSEAQKAPLVLDFHGFPECPSAQHDISCWARAADDTGLLVAYPRANLVFLGDPFGGWLPSDQDVGFSRDIVAYLRECAAIDPASIYASGYSAGGAMAQRLACDAADLFSGVAAVSYGSVYGAPEQCQHQRPIPVLEVRGFTDENVAYCSDKPLSATAEMSAERWRSVIHAPQLPTRVFGPITGNTSPAKYPCDDQWALKHQRACESYTAGDSEYVQCSVHGLSQGSGASYKPASSLSFHRVYRNEENIEVCKEALKLFAAHRLPPPA